MKKSELIPKIEITIVQAGRASELPGLADLAGLLRGFVLDEVRAAVAKVKFPLAPKGKDLEIPGDDLLKLATELIRRAENLEGSCIPDVIPGTTRCLKDIAKAICPEVEVPEAKIKVARVSRATARTLAALEDVPEPKSSDDVDDLPVYRKSGGKKPPRSSGGIRHHKAPRPGDFEEDPAASRIATLTTIANGGKNGT